MEFRGKTVLGGQALNPLIGFDRSGTEGTYTVYRGTSLIRPPPPPRTTIGP